MTERVATRQPAQAPAATAMSVLIVNWNTRELLSQCLDSLFATAGEQELQVVVVDNGSADGSAAMVAARFPGVRLIASATNLGYAEGTNLGLPACTGRAILLANSDIVFTPGALAVMLAELEPPEVGAVACQLRYPDGRIQPSCRSFPTLARLGYEVSLLARLFPRSPRFGAYRLGGFGHDQDREVDQPMMSCLLVKQEVLVAVGGLDGRFPIYFNDVDWCYRVRSLGLVIRFTARAHVFHHHGASTRKLKLARLAHWRRGALDFFHKHELVRAGTPAAACLQGVVALGITQLFMRDLAAASLAKLRR